MSQEEQPKQTAKDSIKPKRSGLMKLLGSTKITPILGLAALISILYYKNKSTKKPKKKAKMTSQVDRKAPIIAPLVELGRTRDGGPMLTRGLFSHGALIARKVSGKIQLGVVLKKAKHIDVLVPGGAMSPLLSWVKSGNGRLALLRTKSHPTTSWNRLIKAVKAAAPGTSLAGLYANAAIALPAPLNDVKLSRDAWLKTLLKRSHYKDFEPKR